jgi:hypothetical protein
MSNLEINATVSTIPAASELVTQDLATTPVTVGTAGKTVFPFRFDLTGFKITSSSAPGETIFEKLVDITILPTELRVIIQQFIKYKFCDLQVSVTSTSPFSVASGSLQLGFNPDPANGFGADNDANLTTAMRLMGSKQVRARDAVTIALPVSNEYKWVKPDGYVRLEQFGFLFALVRSVPAIGDGAIFAVTVSGNIEGFMPTSPLDSDASAFFTELPIITAAEYVLGGPGNDDYTLVLTSAGPAGTLAGVADFKTPLRITTIVADAELDVADQVQQPFKVAAAAASFTLASGVLKLFISTFIYKQLQFEDIVVTDFTVDSQPEAATFLFQSGGAKTGVPFFSNLLNYRRKKVGAMSSSQSSYKRALGCLTKN